MRPKIKGGLCTLAALVSFASAQEKQLEDTKPQDFCFFDQVLVVDLAGKTPAERRRDDLSKPAETALTRHIKSDWPSFSLKENFREGADCGYSGTVLVSLFPREQDQRFFIARYTLNGKIETGLDGQDIEVFVPIENDAKLNILINQASIYIFEKFIRVWGIAREKL